ncbi:efflux RND transporter periplasmic adaptor subunit [Maribellus comscasis]|uniref:Efflux RND transporter periplasmic adaptor subunit n=1 Tax=Maribellus comscasis TaxID=2681766 RepID=A0A6I6JL71_9BACT|nr:efflux RND transporter periplasmic adaptor subunit [Maribellus comscasis]QGY43605.1 efflux RND transporter periplasmic adaptor subunit [Maribellus comscasis]
MSWRKITFIVVALILLLGGAAALSLLFVSMKPDPQRAPEAEIIRSVVAETVKYGEVISPVTRSGRVSSSKEVLLVAEASGKIEAGDVRLKAGESFRKGQLLGTIYKDEAELALKASKSNFLNTLSNILPDLKVDFPEQFNTYYGFFNSIDMEKDLPEFPELKDGKLKVFLASQGVLSEYYTIKQDEKELERHSLYAPFNGTFIDVNFEVGSYVNTGGQIAEMIQTDELEIEVPVENKHSEWIKIGDKVNIHFENGDSLTRGFVVRKSKYINAEQQSRSIFVKVPNAKSLLIAGQYLQVEFPGQKINEAMEIPRAGIFNTNEVFVVLDGELKKKQINILKWNESTLIFNGLDEGMHVVTEALVNVKENTPVNIIGQENTGAGGSGKQVAGR